MLNKCNMKVLDNRFRNMYIIKSNREGESQQNMDIYYDDFSNSTDFIVVTITMVVSAISSVLEVIA